MISKEEVKRIAKLARIALTEKEITQLQKELSSILDYIEKLKEIDVSEIQPASHVSLRKNVMRQDQPEKGLKEENKKLLRLFPSTKEGFLKVKSIFNGVD